MESSPWGTLSLRTFTIQISCFSIRCTINLYYLYCFTHHLLCSTYHLLFDTFASTFTGMNLNSFTAPWATSGQKLCFILISHHLLEIPALCPSVKLWPNSTSPRWESDVSDSLVSRRNSFIHLPKYLRSSHYVPGLVLDYMNKTIKSLSPIENILVGTHRQETKFDMVS